MSQSINLYSQLLNHKLFNKSVKFGLKRIKLALSLLGHPEKKLNNVIEGWDGDKFCHNHNYMTPEDMAMEEGDELDWNYVGAPCHY